MDLLESTSADKATKQPKTSGVRWHGQPDPRIAALLDERRRQCETPRIEEGGEDVVDVKRTGKPPAAPPSPDLERIAERLVKKFGVGEDRRRRLDLYVRLERIVDLHGLAAVEVISDVIADAVSKTKPAHYFCRAVIGRLRDRKLLDGNQKGDASW